MRAQQEIVTDSPDIEVDAPSHVKGVHEGNRPQPLLGREMMEQVEGSRRATGINPKEHEPIDSKMPKLYPS